MGKKRNIGNLDKFFDQLDTDLSHVYKSDCREAFAVDRQRSRARKKARFDDVTLEAKAFAKLREVNELVGVRDISLDSFDIANAQHFITVMLERYTKRVLPDEIQNPFEFSIILDNWRFGPGASNGVLGTHVAAKICQPMTCTSGVEPYVKILRNANPYFSQFDSGGNMGTRLIEGSRITSVPKNEDARRTIAIEPSGNMVLQLAAGSYLEGVLRMIGLDIKTQQPKNKALALRGSLDGSLATIDLSSASDMIGHDLVRLLFPPVWYKFLMSIRSPVASIGGEEITLNMISTMGNGFTFPMMTLIFVSLIYAYRCRTQKRSPTLYVDWDQTAVFGDDIIVPSDEYDVCVDTLERAGFIINKDKSYRDGPFRESCGGDYYEGVDVTPFYVKSLATDADVYVAINQVLEWSAVHGIVPGPTLSLLKSMLTSKVLFVPEWHGPTDGVLTSLVKRRYKHLQAINRRRRIPWDDPFVMMLACGQYVESEGARVVFMPRPKEPRYVLRSSWLPRGYRDGWDPSRSQGISLRISLLCDIFLR